MHMQETICRGPTNMPATKSIKDIEIENLLNKHNLAFLFGKGLRERFEIPTPTVQQLPSLAHCNDSEQEFTALNLQLFLKLRNFLNLR